MRIFLVFLFLFLALHAEDEYQLGEGLQVGSLPVYIGGYFSLDYKHLDTVDRYRIDDIAILSYGNYDKFSYMAEFEFKKFYVKTYTEDETTTSTSNRLYTERLYLDYNLNEYNMFRIGKYNTPIGFWNLLPINVLRETTSSPMSSYILYPKFATGLGASYSSYDVGELKVDFILQATPDLDPTYNNYQADQHYGAGISYEKDDLTLKFNGGYFHRTGDNIIEKNLYYALLSARYESNNYQILSEIGTQQSNNTATTNYAGYIQGTYYFTQRHIGIIRAESYENTLTGFNDNFAVLGYTYRPLYPIALKSEYQVHSEENLDQILLSLSVLF